MAMRISQSLVFQACLCWLTSFGRRYNAALAPLAPKPMMPVTRARPATSVVGGPAQFAAHSVPAAMPFATSSVDSKFHSWASMPDARGSMASGTASTVVRAAEGTKVMKNPVKTVSETIDDFYQAYPSPPVLPMYRPYLVDVMTQAHLAVVESRFKYSALFGLGLWTYFSGLMGTYDKMVSSSETDKIWTAFVSALGMKPDELKADADAMESYAKATQPATILQHLEGSAQPAEKMVSEAFEGVAKNLYTIFVGVGLFRVMELCGVEATKANVEEWARALKVEPVSKVTSDLDIYKLNQDKLKKAEEMMREIEIREKKKLAERLEEKAKALAAKAAEKAAATTPESSST